jgi:hypothetical protein
LLIICANYYLVLGDYQNSSYDSHSWRFVPYNHIIA